MSHNTCKAEKHRIDGGEKTVYIHRKGATRAFGPGHPDFPEALRDTGQPVIIGGSMGTSSYILAGNSGNEQCSFSSACHGAGRALIDELAQRGITIRSPSLRGVAEEAPAPIRTWPAWWRPPKRPSWRGGW